MATVAGQAMLGTDVVTDEDAFAEAVRRSKMLKAGKELELKKIFEGEATETDDEFTIEEMERERKQEAENKP